MSCIPVKTSVRAKKRSSRFHFADVLYSSENVGKSKKKVFTFSDVLYSTENMGEDQKNAGSEIPGQDGIIFQGVFNSPPENFPTSGEFPIGSKPRT